MLKLVVFLALISLSMAHNYDILNVDAAAATNDKQQVNAQALVAQMDTYTMPDNIRWIVIGLGFFIIIVVVIAMLSILKLLKVKPVQRNVRVTIPLQQQQVPIALQSMRYSQNVQYQPQIISQGPVITSSPTNKFHSQFPQQVVNYPNPQPTTQYVQYQQKF